MIKMMTYAWKGKYDVQRDIDIGEKQRRIEKIVLGMSIYEASLLFKYKIFRVIMINGEAKRYDNNFVENRINVAIHDDYIYKIYSWG